MVNSAPKASPSAPVSAPAGLTVLYAGACPLCRAEIGVYRGLASDTPLCFADVSDPTRALPAGLTREQLLARFHVQHADGSVDSGARAFLALWATLPGWRWLARLGRVPGMPTVMEAAYRAFLVFRPALQRLVRRGSR
jgi:predicted DCC family thiol-disulfide oxidoreductase YuxK